MQAYLILRLRSYPAWQVKVNGKAAASLPLRADGLIAVPVSQGPADIAVDWTATPDTILARWLGRLECIGAPHPMFRAAKAVIMMEMTVDVKSLLKDGAELTDRALKNCFPA